MMVSNPGLLVHLVNFLLQIAAVALALRLIRPSGQARAWLVLSCSFVLIAVHRLIDVYNHVTRDEQVLELNDMIVTISVLLLVMGVYLIREVFIEHARARQRLQEQLDELQRFQHLAVGRELRMKELVEENAALRSQIASAKSGGDRS